MNAPEDRIQAELAEPFSYFLVPSDVLGFKDCPEGTQIAHDGALNTAFGEFDLFAGVPLEAVTKRVKTLHSGYLPIVEYSFERGGAQYRVQAFAAPLGLEPRNNLINFIRMTVSNPSEEPVSAGVGAAFVERHGLARCPLNCQEWYRDRFLKSDAFSVDDPFDVRAGLAWRGEHMVFTCDTVDAHAAPRDGRVAYALDVSPGATRIIDFKLPYVPVHKDHTDVIEAIAAANHDDYLARVIKFWDSLLGRATTIDVPEAKVVHTMKASLVYDLIARDITEDGRHFIQKVNEFQYDNFYPRDAAYIIRSYDLLGLHDVAAETVDHFLTYDDTGRPTGLRRIMPDDWGQSLWAVGAHYRTTGDRAFAQRVYPAIVPHVAAFQQACEQDPLGLWPVAGPYDNEAITGHYTGHSFWALLGLTEAIHLAEAVGQTKDVASFRTLRDAYHARFTERLREIVLTTEGYIPPGLEKAEDGCDWANASGGVYPFGVFEPHDPLVTATVKTIREHKYREGIMTYGPNAWAVKQRLRRNAPADPGWLHHYETFYVAETMLARGEQREVLEDFYSILAHTSSTHAGFEFSIRPWGDRDPGGNYPPHGWFAARYNELLRNMLVRENGQDLHLASVLSPVWLEPGKQVRVRNGATVFGTVSFAIEATETGADVRIASEWRDPPHRLILHVPWYVDLASAVVDGESVEATGRTIELQPSVRSMTLSWRWRERPALSYDHAVRHYLEKYHRRRLDADYSFLFPTPRPPSVTGCQGIFIDKATAELFVPGGQGSIYYTLDGNTPDRNATKYSGPIHVTQTTTIKAVTVWPDNRTSEPMETTIEKIHPRSPHAPAEVRPGVEFEYYEGTWDALPDFDSLTPARTGIVPSFDLGGIEHREDNYAVRFRGFVEVEREGIYTFSTTSDDGSRLRIGSTIVVDNDGLHAMREASGTIALGKGRHAITVDYFERGGADRVEVSYAASDAPQRPIPGSALFREVRQPGTE